MFLLTTWRMALTTKRAIILFLSERHISRKECNLYFLPCQMHQKRTKKKSFWLQEEWLSPQKEQLFCSFLNVTFLEKNVICTFCLAKCIRKGQQNCSFWLHEEWLSPQKEQFCLFFSERHLSRKKRHLYFLPCQMHHKRTKKISFWLHEEWLSPQKEQIFSFLS